MLPLFLPDPQGQAEGIPGRGDFHPNQPGGRCPWEKQAWGLGSLHNTVMSMEGDSWPSRPDAVQKKALPRELRLLLTVGFWAIHFLFLGFSFPICKV